MCILNLRFKCTKKKRSTTFSFSKNSSDSIYQFLKNRVCIRSFNVNYCDTAQSCLSKYDFNRRRLPSILPSVDKAGMDAVKTFAICENCGRKIKRLHLDKKITKSEAISA